MFLKLKTRHFIIEITLFVLIIVFSSNSPGQITFTRPAIFAIVGFTTTHDGNFKDILQQGNDIALDKYCSDQFPGSVACRHDNFNFTGIEHRLSVFNNSSLPAWVNGWRASCRIELDSPTWSHNFSSGVPWATGRVLSKGNKIGEFLSSEEESCASSLPVACCSYRPEDIYVP